MNQPSEEADQVVCVHPNVLYSIGKKARVASRLHGQGASANDAAGISKQKERAIPEDARGMKMRMDYQSKVNCMPNSLTLQYEADQKRSKSSVNILKSSPLEHSTNILNPEKRAQENPNQDAQPDLRFRIYDSRSKSTTAQGRRKQFKDQNFKVFEKSLNLKEPESEDQLNIYTQLRNKRCKSNTSKGHENVLEGLVSQEFMRQLDTNFMALKESKIESWQRGGTRSRMQGNQAFATDEDFGTAQKSQIRLKQSFSPMALNRADDIERNQRFQQTHTAKRKNERSQELYRSHFNLEHQVERSLERPALHGHKEGPNVSLGAKKQRNPIMRDIFRSQVQIN